MTSGTIVVVGSANMDLVVASEALPRPGETLLGGSFGSFAGGKGANQAVAAARAGGRVAMIGCVGDDAFGKRMRDGLEQDDIDVGNLTTVGGPTGVALIVTARGENIIVVAPGANDAVHVHAVDEGIDRIGNIAILMCQLEIPIDSVIFACKRARDVGATVILDPAPARTLPKALLELADWITPNESEARTLLGVVGDEPLDPADAAKRLQALGAKNVLISLSDKGCLLMIGEEPPITVQAYAVETVDSTGAGDAFNGAFATALAEGETAFEAARFATAAAAIAVTRRGAQPSMATRDEIRVMMKRRLTDSRPRA